MSEPAALSETESGTEADSAGLAVSLRGVTKVYDSGVSALGPFDLDVRKGLFVDFFGKPASTSDAVARLSIATGAPVMPAFMVRQGDTLHHHIKILPAFYPERTRDREATVREYTQQYSDTLEQIIREHPDHWNWIHRRWKTRPPGESRFY